MTENSNNSNNKEFANAKEQSTQLKTTQNKVQKQNASTRADPAETGSEAGVPPQALPSITQGKGERHTDAPALQITTTKRPHNCDILLNNFQIKNKRYRVLLNYDHIVWERLGSKRNCDNSNNNDINNGNSSSGNDNKNNSSHTKINDSKNAIDVKINEKETAIETEQLASKAVYGNTSKVLHINEVICIKKGQTKAATLQANNVTSAGSTSAGVVFPITTPAAPTTIPNALSTSTPVEQYLTIHYAERVNKSPTDCNRWHIRCLTLFNTDPYIIQQWHTLLEKMLQNSKRRRVERLLVFINPYGGRKRGLQTYERHCKPVFQLAGIDASCIISQRANQIRDILMTHDLSHYDAVCCVGGDGTVAEVINGLIFRAMHDLNLDPTKPAYIPKPQLPVGIIPAGSTDTIAYSVHGTADERTAAIHLILGQCRGLDVCSVSNRQGLIRFCSSVLSYGYLGDVAAKSEKYRWMGTKRYEYAGIKAFLLNRGYDAEIRIIEKDEMEIDATAGSSSQNINNGRDENDNQICYANCQHCRLALEVSMLKTKNQNQMESNRQQSVDAANNDDQVSTSTTNSFLITSKDNNKRATITHNAVRKPNSTGEKFMNKSDNDINTDDNNDDDDDDFDDDNVDNTNRNVNLANCDKNLKSTIMKNQLKKDKQIKALLSDDDNDVEEEDATLANDNSNKKNLIEPTISYASTNSINKENTPIIEQDNGTNPKWKTIKGQFFMISGANITCACSRSPNGISRYSHLGDGNLDLILVRKTTLWNNVRFVINTMGRSGDIRKLPFVETYRTNRFTFQTPFSNTDEQYSIAGSCQPITDNDPDDDLNVSRWNCDGEVVNDLDITMISHCQLIDVFMRGPYKYNPLSKKSDKKKNKLWKLCFCNDSAEN